MRTVASSQGTARRRKDTRENSWLAADAQATNARWRPYKEIKKKAFGASTFHWHTNREAAKWRRRNEKNAVLNNTNGRVETPSRRLIELNWIVFCLVTYSYFNFPLVSFHSRMVGLDWTDSTTRCVTTGPRKPNVRSAKAPRSAWTRKETSTSSAFPRATSTSRTLRMKTASAMISSSCRREPWNSAKATW